MAIFGGFNREVLNPKVWWLDPLPCKGIEYTPLLHDLCPMLIKVFVLGKLTMEKFSSELSFEIDGSKLFGVNAFENSKSSLGSISISVFTHIAKWNFDPATLNELNNVTLLYHYDFASELFPPSVLHSLQDLYLDGKGLYHLKLD